MNQTIKKLIEDAGTDVSGKWIRTENVEQLLEIVIRQCADLAGTESSKPHSTYTEKIKAHYGVNP